MAADEEAYRRRRFDEEEAHKKRIAEIRIEQESVKRSIADECDSHKHRIEEEREALKKWLAAEESAHRARLAA